MITKPPFPWFGGKSSIAGEVWARFGDVANYVEPFFGSGAVLLLRPEHHRRKVETVNDKDGFLSNFWRALKYAPSEVARYADWPAVIGSSHRPSTLNAWSVTRITTTRSWRVYGYGVCAVR